MARKKPDEKPEAPAKNKQAQGLAALRWKNTTPKERSQFAADIVARRWARKKQQTEQPKRKTTKDRSPKKR